MTDPDDDLEDGLPDPFALIQRTPFMLDGQKRGHRRAFARILVALLRAGRWWRQNCAWWKQRHRPGSDGRS